MSEELSIVLARFRDRMITSLSYQYGLDIQHVVEIYRFHKEIYGNILETFKVIEKVLQKVHGEPKLCEGITELEINI